MEAKHLQDAIQEWVPLVEIRVDSSYQRAPPTPAMIRRMATAWDEEKANVVVLSLRDDNLYYVVDGQTRVAAARLADREYIRAMVLIGLTIEREAELFAVLNSERRKPTALDVFKARVRAKDPTAVLLLGLVRRHGFDVGAAGGGINRRGKLISAVVALEDVYKAGGYEHLDQVFRLLKEGFGNDASGYKHWSLRGMSAFLRRYGEHCNEARVIECLQREGILGMLQRMRIMQAGIAPSGSMANVWGQVLLSAYNRRLTSNRLPDWKDLRFKDDSKIGGR